ncbi:MAG: right-handed parallel beta-helix repeat-containing protein [Candidatus Thorarchaeota archaeon]
MLIRKNMFLFPRFWMVVIAITLFSTTTLFPLSGDYIAERDSNSLLDNEVVILAASPIYVTNDTELLTAAGSDYVFEDLIIDVAGPEGFGIQITNTTTPFVIRNCTVIGIDGGIYLGTVHNATLENVICDDNSGIGITIYDSWNITISNTTCSSNHDGIRLTYDTSNVTISNSSVEYNSEYGVYIDTSSFDNNIQNSSFVENLYDAWDDHSSGSSTFYHNFYSYYDGIDVDPRDQIGDTPCEIGGAYNQDPQPLMLPNDRYPISWTDTPPNPYYVEYGERIEYDIDAVAYGGLDDWTVNSSFFDVSEDGVLTEAAWLPVGVYNLNVTISNLYAYSLEFIFSLVVEDTVSPEWVETPVDQYIEVGDSFSYDLNATDLSIPLWYNISGSIDFVIDPSTGIFTSSTPLTQVDTYLLTATSRDSQLNFRNTLFTLHVVDSTPPEWVEDPIHQTLEFDTPFVFDLNATDYSSISAFGINDTEHFVINIDGVITNATYLDIGVYPLGVWVNDTYGNTREHTIIVNIVDTTSPVWVITPTNQYVELGNDLSAQFSAWDSSGIGYWTVNNTSLFDASSTGVIMSFGGLEISNYSLSVTCYDIYGNGITADFIVTVNDTLAPIWIAPLTDLNVEKGVSMSYSLRAADPSGLVSWLIAGSTPFSVDSAGLVTNTTSLEVDTYVLVISVSDSLGHTLQDSLTVEVVDTTPPTWLFQEYEFNILSSDNFDILLEVEDLSDIVEYSLNDTIHFSVTSDGRLQSSGLLGQGVYVVEVTATDYYDNSASITLTIIVTDSVTGYLIITGIVVVVFISGVGLIILLFDPKRGRFGLSKGADSK